MVRRLAALAVLLAAGCGSTRPIDAQPPFDDHGILVTVKPRAYIGILGMETIRGTVENRAGHDVDLLLYLNLVDDKGAIVGHALVIEDDLRRGATRSFDACATPGGPWSWDFRLFEKPPPYVRVTRGLAWDRRVFDSMFARLHWIALRAVIGSLPQAADPAAQARAS